MNCIYILIFVILISKLIFIVHLLELFLVLLSILLITEGVLLCYFELQLSDQIFFNHQGQTILDAFNVVRVELGRIVRSDHMEYCTDKTMPARHQR